MGSYGFSNQSLGSDYNTPISGLLGTSGLDSGTTNHAADYAGGNADTAYIQAGATETIRLNRMLIVIEDTTINDLANFGGLGAPLSNGITFSVLDEDSDVRWTTTQPITRNLDLQGYFYDAQVNQFAGGTNDSISCRWTFRNNMTSNGIVLHPTWQFSAGLSDNLSDLITLQFRVQGASSNDWEPD